ncbi:MAG: AAA family ATPase [Candidatus Aenigmatarchaeota archaeon]
MIVLCIVGKLGAGKDTASDYLCRKYGFVPVSYSEIAHEKTRESGLETTRANLQKVSTHYRKTYGEDVFAKIVVEKAKALGDMVLLKEARTKQDVLPAMKEFGGAFHIIEITVKEQTRFERLKKRGSPKDAKTMREFLAQQKREEELGYFGAAEMAEFRLDNDGTPEELYKKLDELMKQMT